MAKHIYSRPNKKFLYLNINRNVLVRVYRILKVAVSFKNSKQINSRPINGLKVKIVSVLKLPQTMLCLLIC